MLESVASSVSSAVHQAATVPGLEAFWFFLAALLLDTFDVALPRGDTIQVSGALCAAGLIILGPIVAAVTFLSSQVIAHVARRGRHSAKALLSHIVSRIAGLLMATTVAYFLIDAGASQQIAFYIVPGVFLISETTAQQLLSAAGSGRPLSRLLLGGLTMQGPLIVAQWSTAVLVLITYGGGGRGPGMGSWSLIPALALLLLIRRSYALLLEIRETYLGTVEVLVEAAEGQDSRRAGHSERTALVARSIGVKIGLSANQVERISYAALLHDIDAIADESRGAVAAFEPEGHSSNVVESARFFADVVDIVRMCDGGEPLSEGSAADMLAAVIVALASDIDAMNHPEVAAAHGVEAVNRITQRVPSALRAQAAGAALSLGYRIPAM